MLMASWTVMGKGRPLVSGRRRVRRPAKRETAPKIM